MSKLGTTHKLLLLVFLLLATAFASFASEKATTLVSNTHGIKFLFMREPSAPLVHIRIVFKRAGASYQEKSKSCLPMLYSDTVFFGCGENSKAQLRQKMENLAVSLNCASDSDNIWFSMTVPKLVLAEAISLLNDAINRPNFEEKEVKIAQNSIAGALQNYAINPQRFACNVFLPSLIFKLHPYENGYGSNFEDLMKLSVDDLKKYKEMFLVMSNAEACVFGDISENEAKELLDKLFSGVKKGKLADDIVKDIEPNLSSEMKKYNIVGNQSTVAFALKGLHPSSHKKYALIVLYNVLGGPVFKSRIMSELRKKHGFIYFGYVFPVNLNHANYFAGILQTENSKVDQAITFLKEIIKNLKEKGITKSDLEFSKNNIKGRLLVELRTSGDLCDFYFNRMKSSITESLDETLKGISDVTLDEVNALAKEILDEDKIPFIVIGGNE